MSNLVRTAGVLGFGALLLSLKLPSAAPQNFYYPTWSAIYPSSCSGENVRIGTGYDCFLCHGQSQHHFNAYGWAIRKEWLAGASIDEAIVRVEALNSDGDPTGATNLDEILAGTQPGWTPGPNNTTYYRDGTVFHNEPPPEKILGRLDPTHVPASATFRNGTGINPACLRSLSAPQLGTTWRIAVSTGSEPAATLTVLRCHALPGTGPILPYGEVLLDLDSPLLFTTIAVPQGGTAVHTVLLPEDPCFLGFTASIQAVILSGGTPLQLCNAEDVVLGGAP